MYHVTVVIDFVDYICRIFEIQTMKPFIVPSKQCCPTCGPPAHFVWPAAVLYCFEGQFPEMSCKKVLTMFGSTYVCKAGFSAMNNIKSKKRNSLTDEHLENLLRQQSLSISFRSIESLQHSRVKFLTDIL